MTGLPKQFLTRRLSHLLPTPSPPPGRLRRTATSYDLGACGAGSEASPPPHPRSPAWPGGSPRPRPASQGGHTDGPASQGEHTDGVLVAAWKAPSSPALTRPGMLESEGSINLEEMNSR